MTHYKRPSIKQLAEEAVEVIKNMPEKDFIDLCNSVGYYGTILNQDHEDSGEDDA